MKRTLALLLAVAFAVPAFAGNIFSNVETYGEIETIGLAFNSEIPAVNDAKGVNNRVLFGVSMDLVEDVRANLTFAYTNQWEDSAVTENDTVNDYWDNIQVAEANVVVSNIFGALEAKIGRQFYGNENSPVMYIGPRHGRYNLIDYPESIDAALVTWANDSLAISAIYGQAGDKNGVTAEHARMTGLTLDYAFTNNLTAGAYWYDFLDQDYSDDHIGIWGGKVAYQNEEANLAVEYAKNYIGHVFGHNNEGWMLKADAAMTVDMEAMALTPRITYLHEEKDFIANGNYNPGIIFTYVYEGTTGGDNLRILNPGLDFAFKALEKVTFAFDYMAIKADNHWNSNEFDLVATYQHNDYVSFHLGGAIATHLENDVKDVYAGQMGMTIKF